MADSTNIPPTMTIMPLPGGAAPEGFTTTTTNRQMTGYWLGAAVLALLGTAVLAFGYLFIAFPADEWPDLEAHHYMHIGLAVATNFVCIAAAIRTRGLLEERLLSALVWSGIVHAAAIFILFVFRFYYSRPIVILSVFASLSLASLATLLVERFKPRRIGVVPQGLEPSFMPWLGPDAIPIDVAKSRITDFDLVLVNFSERLDQEWVDFISEAMLSGRPVRHIPAYIEQKRGRVSPEHFKPHHANSIWLNPYTRIFKRLLDLTLVVIALPVAVPIVAAASLAIFWQMGWPVFFVQNRIGMGGRQFRIYKLRTMRPSSTSTSATSKADNRVTPLGQFLRRYRIDELPQLLNIIKGDMSLVGPRPEQPSLTRRYLETVPMFRYRNMLPPGITGWAQINAGYAADEEESQEKLLYDLYYIKHASLLLDLWILIKTVRTVLSGSGVR